MWCRFQRRGGDVEDFTVYSYEHLDDLSFLRKPEDVFEDEPTGALPVYIDAIQTRLKKAGWEGDGKLGIMWFSPFADVGIEDTWGTYAWCVKQSNSGTSWIASETPLPFKRLEYQNREFPYKTHRHAGVMWTACMELLKKIKAERDRTRRLISDLSPDSPSLAEISRELLLNAQGEMVAQFNYFLGDSYLEVIDEVIAQGNRSQLKLSKFKATIETNIYLPDSRFVSEDDAEANRWFTMRGLIRDIWISYKFEPFQQKTTMLFKACEFPTNSPEMQTIRIHVQLRNCVQHHERRVTPESLQALRVQRIELLNEEGKSLSLGSGDIIIFSYAELKNLATGMARMVSEFYKHTTKRIRRKIWVPRRRLKIGDDEKCSCK